MDYVAQPIEAEPDMEAFVGLHYYITTGGEVRTEADIRACLQGAGFTDLRCTKVIRMPFQALCLARKAGKKPRAPKGG